MVGVDLVYTLRMNALRENYFVSFSNKVPSIYVYTILWMTPKMHIYSTPNTPDGLLAVNGPEIGCP